MTMTTPPKLLSSYATPTFRLGDVVRCARRGDARITGLSDAPIPWPTGQLLKGGRRPALVLYAGLAEAVKRESAESVMHSWGVGKDTVWPWRKALGTKEGVGRAQATGDDVFVATGSPTAWASWSRSRGRPPA